MHEYEEIGRSSKINGHYYNLRCELKSKNKYYKCDKRVGSIKCRGSITISPDRHVIKKVEHSCKIQDKILEKVQEYEETDGRFKINGDNYNLISDSRSKNKYYVCNKRYGQKCRGSIILSPNHYIIKKVAHTCELSKNKNDPSVIKTIDGCSYYFNQHKKLVPLVNPTKRWSA